MNQSELDICIHNAANAAASLLQQLETEQDLDETQALILQRQLEKLRELPEKSDYPEAETGVENMAYDSDELHEMEKLKERFDIQAEDAKQILQETLTLISAGRAPDQALMDRLDGSVDTLHSCWLDLYNRAQELLPEEEMPGEDVTAEGCVEAVRNSFAMRYRKQIAAYRDILQKFLSVRAHIEIYKLALEPFQAKARELLHDISQETLPPAEYITEQMQGPEIFLQALNCHETAPDSELELLDKISEIYSRHVSYGLSGRCYYLPAVVGNETADTSCSASSAPVQTAELQPAVPEAAEMAEERTAQEVGLPAESDSGTASTEPGESEGDQDLPAPAAEEESRLAALLRENGALESADYGEFHPDIISQAEQKKISASIFKSELNGHNMKACRVIFSQLLQHDSFDENRLTGFYNIPQAVMVNELDYLYRRGYIRKFTLIPGGSCYCASPRLKKALNFQEVKRFLNLRHNSVPDWPLPDAEDPAAAAARITSARLFSESLQRLSVPSGGKYTGLHCIRHADFIITVAAAEVSADCELLAGIFCDDPAECEAFESLLQKKLKSIDHIVRMVTAGIDIPHARVLAEVILQTADCDLSRTEVLLYVLSEEQYYAYPALEPVNAEQITADPAAGLDTEAKAACEADPTESETETETETDSGPEREFEAEPALRTETGSESEDGMQTAVEPNPESNPTKTSTEDSILPARETRTFMGLAESFRGNLYKMLTGGKFYAAALYARAYAETGDEAALLSRQLSYALRDPLEHCSYTATEVFNLIGKRADFEDALLLATSIRTFFSNQAHYDYNERSLYDSINGTEDALLNRFPGLRSAAYDMMRFKTHWKRGMDAYAAYRRRDQVKLDADLRAVQQEAAAFYENYIAGQKKDHAKQRRFLETKELIFSTDSGIGQNLKVVMNNDKKLQSQVQDFLRENFFRENSNIDEDAIDEALIWKYIQSFWEKAGEKMEFRYRDDLKSRLRSNITSQTTRAVRILTRWCSLLEQSGSTTDPAVQDYQQQEGRLAGSLREACDALEDRIRKTSVSLEEKAGLSVLCRTLQEILACLDGSFREEERQYFYAPFLLTGNVILNEDFIPDLNMPAAEPASLQLPARILAHLDETGDVEITPDSFAVRLQDLLEGAGDDCGSARLLYAYLTDTASQLLLSDTEGNIAAGVAYARQRAELCRDDFIGELELAQSYGQIVSSTEDRKEIILQTINEWFAWAEDTGNYSFFKKVTDAYLEEIHESAREREAELLFQLRQFENAELPGLPPEEKQKRITKIRAMLKEQNYTVAEDLLRHGETVEIEEIRTDPWLEDFLDNYDLYYRPVASGSRSFASLVNSRTWNKEERGAKRLADNWLPGGSNLGMERLKVLLTALGFNPAEIKAASGRYETYFVKSAVAVHKNYTHPVAAFGSGAERDGFRVVCINGSFNADTLLNVMQGLGNTKHTLILLDCALTLSMRRQLARKTKNVLSDKMFVVVDRVVMLYLVRHYNETVMNRMLFSLTAPFSWYQPYVWDSARVMPPEIFMGRRKELEKIESAGGVNIVYGGRQLGKSALLKKARDDIDHNENGDRAVYVDIKGLNYEQAARKIGQILFEKGVLDEDLDITDWAELTKHIRRRLQLQTEAARIPYLLLLIDEADAFIESCEAVNYSPLDALKDLQQNSDGSAFKFVIAGLHNVVRFHREAALSKNSVITHLQVMTVKPFQPAEARELLEVPLHYLGLRFPKEKEHLVTLILASTNYFPGLIQLYCAKLLEAMRNDDYAGYDEVNSPVYEVREAHIKKVLADPDFTAQIKEKYFITLKLAEDDYYYLIALLIAWLYHTNSNRQGYTAEDVQAAGETLEIHRIADLPPARLSAFMEELTELNVLRKQGETQYLFSRYTFFQMMGSLREVEDELLQYMEE